jgi:small-conductance mechanosensitive channel
MGCRFFSSRLARGLLALLLLSLTLACPVQAQESEAKLAAELETARLALDRLEFALKAEDFSVEQLTERGRIVTALRDRLLTLVTGLEGRVSEVETAIAQLGLPPEAGAPPEDPAIAAERGRLNRQFNALDTLLKQARLLALRAEQLAARIADLRRSTYARGLFARSPSLFAPLFWIEVARALPAELNATGALIGSWWAFVRDNERLPRTLASVIAIVVSGIGLAYFLRWWRRRLTARATSPTQFAKTLVSLGVLLRIALTGPALILVSIGILSGSGLLFDGVNVIALGIAAAVLVAALIHGVSSALLAPDEPWRRLIAFDDRIAGVLHRRLVWSAGGFAVAFVVMGIHKAVDAPPVLMVATNHLLGAFTAVLLIHLLWRLRRSDEQDAVVSNPRVAWMRAIAWLMLLLIATALTLGYAALAGYVAARLVITIAILGVLRLLMLFVNSLIDDLMTLNTARSRSIAALFGVDARRIGLVGSMLSAGVSLLLLLIAAVVVLGPWQLSAADYFGLLQDTLGGFRVGEFNISVAATLSAAVVLLVVLLGTRVMQRWLERQLLPRTDIEPSLQQSIVVIAGYAGAIVAIALAMVQLGINLQNVALIAGALSVGIGFGLQSIVSNFICGLILLTERPIRVGDWVVVKGEEGYVRRIRVRATEIETLDRASVIIPNADLITNAVTNRTHGTTIGRVTIKVGVAYDSDPDEVRKVLLECADEHSQVLKFPAPAALLLNFGASSLDFELRCHIANVNQHIVIKSDLHYAILRRFRAVGIEIPFPQQEILVRQGKPGPAADAAKTS